MAHKILPPLELTKHQVDSITSLILATQMPHHPTGLLDCILIDADMAILSSDDFWQSNDELRAELELLGEPLSDSEWYESQLTFLEGHRYFTNVSVTTREEIKQKHMRELRRRPEDCCSDIWRPQNGQPKGDSLVKSENDG